MTYSARFAALAFAAVLFGFSCPLHAQNPDLPSAPAVSPSAPAAPAAEKPVFRLPLGTPTTVAAPTGPPPPAPDQEMLCYAPAEGIYARHAAFSAAQQRAIDDYLAITFHQLRIEWDRHMPRAVNDPWIKGKVVGVRFAIMPDGSIDTPLVVLPSGRRSYDDHALDAIKASTPFSPLPEGVKRPIPVCMKFGYNVEFSAEKPKPLDLYPGTAKPKSPNAVAAPSAPS